MPSSNLYSFFVVVNKYTAVYHFVTALITYEIRQMQMHAAERNVNKSSDESMFGGGGGMSNLGVYLQNKEEER